MHTALLRSITAFTLLWLCLMSLVRYGAEAAAGHTMLFWVSQREGFALHFLDADKGILAPVVASPPYRALNPPQLAPDGERILFEVERNGERALFLLDRHGAVLYEQDRRVGIRQPVWSPDGSRVAYWGTTDGFWRFYLMNRDGEAAQSISDTVGLVPYTYPLWSPDGRYILYRIWVTERGSTIYLLDTHTGASRTLADVLSATGDLVWSPDGRWLAYRSERSRNGEVHVLDVETGEEHNLTHHPAIDFQPDWSPDGRELVFVSNRAGQGDLFRMSADGSLIQRVTSGGAWRPDWSPDGDQIAFISRRSGRDQLYTIHPDGSGLRAITDVHAGIVFLGWFGELPRN
jgi:Tol biopolymer transport system component